LAGGEGARVTEEEPGGASIVATHVYLVEAVPPLLALCLIPRSSSAPLEGRTPPLREVSSSTNAKRAGGL